MAPLMPRVDLNDDLSRHDVFNLTPCAQFGGITIDELCGLIDTEWEGRVPPNPPRFVIHTPGLFTLIGLGWSTSDETQTYAKSDPEKIKKLLDKLRKEGRAKRCRAEVTTVEKVEGDREVKKIEEFEVWVRVDPPQRPQDPKLELNELECVKREKRVLWLPQKKPDLSE